jgi:hypothetical protein
MGNGALGIGNDVVPDSRLKSCPLDRRSCVGWVDGGNPTSIYSNRHNWRGFHKPESSISAVSFVLIALATAINIRSLAKLGFSPDMARLTESFYQMSIVLGFFAFNPTYRAID